MRDQAHRIHFVGIGGSGMCGIAEVLTNLGNHVSGSDLAENPATRRLAKAGAKIYIGHDAKHVSGCEVVVVSTAISEDNPEVKAAMTAQIPVVRRAEMLAELMRLRRGIAVAGTHGKTTTTSLVAAILGAADLDPTFVVGGLVTGVGTNARLGEGEYLVAEADESDASFLHLQPEIAVVTNIDADHMETYGGDLATLDQSFVDFLHNLPFYGLAILCADDLGIARIIGRVRKPVMSYGFSEQATIRASDVGQHGTSMRFRLHRPDHNPLTINLAMPGRHNVLNALAAIAVADRLKVSDKAIQQGLESFAGIDRRFQTLGEVALKQGSVLLVDDYAHHPKELAATLAAARGSWPNRRLVVVFQPHRYSRTRDLLEDFSRVLADVDPLVVSEVYPAGEQVINAADGRALCRAIRARSPHVPVFIEQLDELASVLAAQCCDGDVILTLGAGDIGRAAHALIENGLPEASQ